MPLTPIKRIFSFGEIVLLGSMTSRKLTTSVALSRVADLFAIVSGRAFGN
ncbi:uncharacterized protein G2W53_025503 [Senna tora]|uniref:Uncharacterized protein n=1 Tax=Senna tora TaxID=362788 RepID=A0A834TD77_9FABA|nr:uncharacterized protein G2W53_025503 [Senna tora]